MQTSRCGMLRQTAVVARSSGLAVIEMQSRSGCLSGQVKFEIRKVGLRRGGLRVWQRSVFKTVTRVPLAEVER